ncbi:MAG: outer membrane lipoprotein carrier protein LolA [Myxococcota bacterium]|nr:outer membrane lipoprotein carrier protein LolA [Myxococcota bacterium]
MKSDLRDSLRFRAASGRAKSAAGRLAAAVTVVLAIASPAHADPRPGPPGKEDGGPPRANCPPVQATLALVQGRYDGIGDLSASFEQETRSVVLAGSNDRETSRGKVLLAKPGRMRWAYDEPDPSFVISDGETIWVHDVGSSQVTRMPMGEGYLAGAALDFLFGEGRIEENFLASTLACGAGETRVELLPREAATYERLSLTIGSEDGLVTATSITDLFGNQTTIRFSDIHLNQSPPGETFRFEKPEGAEVIDLSTGR